MARAKQCEEEFNPWPPFVDVFSSVILVLLLFVMVMIVNVAYYMQFNSKTNSEATTKSTKASLQAGVDTTDMITLPKVEKPKMATAGRESLFEGGKSDGNAISVNKNDKKIVQKTMQKGKKFIISYDTKEIFLKGDIKKKLKAFLAKYKDRKIVVTMGLSVNMVSKTYAKQIALSRMISVRNIASTFSKNVDIQISKKRDKNYPNGFVEVEVR